MTDYLVFRLYAPLASWGDAAVGETRPTNTYPGRSAIIGLLGAALGVRRDDEAGQTALFRGLRVAVKQHSPGSLLRDYHTAQVPATQSKVRYRTRRDELNAPGKVINTILSSRQYRCDGLWTVAVWLTPESALNLTSLHSALLRPVFPLYLGRKACPLGAPLAPDQVQCETLVEALDHAFPELIPHQRRWFGAGNGDLYVWEGEAETLDGSAAGVEVSDAWDNPLSRTRWQFGPRKAFRRYHSHTEGH